VETPDVPQLPWRMDAGVKEFHLIAEPVKQEIVPGRLIDLWGYNGNAPGQRFKSTKAIAFASSSTTTSPKRHRCTGMDLRSRSRWMDRRE